MIDRSKKLPAFFHENSNGRQFVREWILALSSEDRKRFDRWKDRARDFLRRRGGMVLLHAFIKKTRKTPERDLRLATTRMKEMN